MKRIKRFIPILIFILLIGTKVDAITGSASIHDNPKATEKGNYITLKHTVDAKSDEMSITYSYDNKFLQLIGFIPTSNGTCIMNGDKIDCQNVNATEVIIYPVFKITNDLNANKDINITFNFIDGQGNAKITVRKIERIIEATSIDVEEINKDLKVGDTYQIKAAISPSNANNKTITYKSSNEEIATVDENGLVTTKSEGLVYITLSSSSLRSVVELKITKEEIALEKVTSPEKISIKVGEERLFEVKLNPSDATIDKTNIKYATSDNKVAVVNSDGEIVGVGKGDATITATIGEKTTITKVTVTDEGINEKEKNSDSAVVPCIITAALTFIFTIILMFVIKTKKTKKENGIDEEEQNNYTSFKI